MHKMSTNIIFRSLWFVDTAIQRRGHNYPRLSLTLLRFFLFFFFVLFSDGWRSVSAARVNGECISLMVFNKINVQILIISCFSHKIIGVKHFPR